MESKLKSHAQTNNLTDVVGGASKIIVFSVFRVKMWDFPIIGPTGDPDRGPPAVFNIICQRTFAS